MFRHLRFTYSLALAAMALVAVAGEALAQTPEGTVITNTMTFTVANAGNGTDSMTISENISVAGVITVTGYRYGATTYGTLAALNTALASVGIAQAGSITLKIVYDVAGGQGGVTTVYTLTANSRRTPASSGNAA